MKTRLALTSAALIAALAATLSAAEGNPRYETAPGGDNEMGIEGSATGHSWRVKGAIIRGFMEVDPAWVKDLTLKSVTCLGSGKAPKCQTSIPVRSLKSQVAVGSSIMDNRMVKELKGEKFSSIDYTLTEMTVSGEVPTSGSPVTFDTKGKLSVAGQTNEVSFPVTMERLGEDKLRFKGSLKTKMTAFGVTPPEFTVLGVGSKTADDITLTWKWTVGLKAEAPKP